MTAAMDIRQTAHYMAVAICTLIVQAFPLSETGDWDIVGLSSAVS